MSQRKLPAVLVIDDEVRSQEALRRTLEEDFDVHCASSAAEGMEILEKEQSTAAIRIVLCDQRMPGITGVQFLKEVRHRWPDIVRIILSGYTDAEDIITGVNEAGIWQYLLKPWQPDQLLLTLQRAAEVWRLQQENQRLSLDLRTAEPVLKRRVESKFEKAKHAFGLAGLIRAPDSPLNAVCDMIARIAPYDLSVLVTGESGTGKELSRTGLACSSKPMVAPCFSMKSAKPARRFRSNCCACCRRASSARWAAIARRRSMCALLRRPIAILKRTCTPGVFARIFTIVWRPSPCMCRPCASVPATSCR